MVKFGGFERLAGAAASKRRESMEKAGERRASGCAGLLAMRRNSTRASKEFDLGAAKAELESSGRATSVNSRRFLSRLGSEGGRSRSRSPSRASPSRKPTAHRKPRMTVAQMKKGHDTTISYREKYRGIRSKKAREEDESTPKPMVYEKKQGAFGGNREFVLHVCLTACFSAVMIGSRDYVYAHAFGDSIRRQLLEAELPPSDTVLAPRATVAPVVPVAARAPLPPPLLTADGEALGGTPCPRTPPLPCPSRPRPRPR